MKTYIPVALGIIFLLFSACGKTTATSTMGIPTADTPTPTSTPEPEISWITVSNNLAIDPSWMEERVKNGFALELTNTGLILSTGEGAYASPINIAGPTIEFLEAFGILIEFESSSSSFAGVSLYGALSQGEWWEGITRLDIGSQGGNLAVGYWDGTSPTPIVWVEYPVPGIYANQTISVILRKMGDQFIILKNGFEIGRVTDPGLFASGHITLGLNVAPNNEFFLHSILVQAPDGYGVVIK